MAHPKHRTSPVNTKRSLEFAGKVVDLIGRGFSKDTSSNQNVEPKQYSVTYNNNLIMSSADRNKVKRNSTIRHLYSKK